MVIKPKQQTNINNRIFGLDLLRACAIMFVVIGHGNYLLSNKYTDIIDIFFGYGGVSIFFVLSGFLIGGILIKNFRKEKRREKYSFELLD